MSSLRSFTTEELEKELERRKTLLVKVELEQLLGRLHLVAFGKDGTPQLRAMWKPLYDHCVIEYQLGVFHCAGEKLWWSDEL